MSVGPTPNKLELEAMLIDRRLHRRECMVRQAEIKIVHGVLKSCLLTESENAKENCQHLIKRYIQMATTHAHCDKPKKLEMDKYYRPQPDSLIEDHRKFFPEPDPRGIDKRLEMYLGRTGDYEGHSKGFLEDKYDPAGRSWVGESTGVDPNNPKGL